MTNAQFDVLLQKLDMIEKRQLQIAAIQAKHTELLVAISNDKIDINSLRNSIDELAKLVDSIRDEVEA